MKRYHLAMFMIFLFSVSLQAQTTAAIDGKSMKGQSLSQVFDALMQLGFTSITPVPVQSQLPRETVIGLRIRGGEVQENVRYAVDAPIQVLVSMGSTDMFEAPKPPESVRMVDTAPIVMTGMRAAGVTVTTAPIVMTGMRATDLTVTTAPIVMTGMRATDLTVTTAPIVMTGMRATDLTVTTAPIVMTGIRATVAAVTTAPIVMTGMRARPVSVTTPRIIMTGMRPLVDADRPPPTTIEQKADDKRPRMKPAQDKQADKPAQPQKPKKVEQPKKPEQSVDTETADQPPDSAALPGLKQINPTRPRQGEKITPIKQKK